MTRSRSPLPFTAVIDRYLEKLARAPYLPHRQFQSDTTEPIGARYPRVQRLYQRSRAADHKYIGRLLGRVVRNAAEDQSPPAAVREALLDLVIDLARQNGITFNLPGVDATRPLLFSEQQERTSALIDIESYLANEARDPRPLQLRRDRCRRRHCPRSRQRPCRARSGRRVPGAAGSSPARSG